MAKTPEQIAERRRKKHYIPGRLAGACVIDRRTDRVRVMRKVFPRKRVSINLKGGGTLLSKECRYLPPKLQVLVKVPGTGGVLWMEPRDVVLQHQTTFPVSIGEGMAKRHGGYVVPVT